ncbi:MAG: hypothetical protein V4515_04505 [Chloroflexota bacterium]
MGRHGPLGPEDHDEPAQVDPATDPNGAEVADLHARLYRLGGRLRDVDADVYAELPPEPTAEQLRAEHRRLVEQGVPPSVLAPPPGLVLPDDRIERKVAFGLAAGTGAVVLGAIATGVLDNLALLDGLPPWARFLVVAVFVPAAGAAAGYVARSNRAP